MKTERRITFVDILLNGLVSFVKIYAGMVFCSYTLMASGYYTLTMLAHEILAYSGSLFRGRRANMDEPFGFGKFECISYMFFGIILIILAIYMIVKSFFLNYVVSDIHVLVVILFLTIFKFMLANKMFNSAKNIQSDMLMYITHNAYYDYLVSIFTIVIVILSSIWSVFDLIGSIIISGVILYKGFKIVLDNIVLIKGQNDKAKSTLNKIKKLINKFEGVTYSNCNLINVGSFYKVEIDILIDENVFLDELITWERKVKRELKRQKLNIKMVGFKIYKNN